MNHDAREPVSRSLTLASLALAVLCVSFAAIFFRLAEGVHPLAQSALRLSFAFALMLPILVWRWKRHPPTRSTLRLAFWGGLFYALHFGAWVSSLTLTSVATSVTLVTTTPLFLGIWGWFTKRDAPTPRLWLSLVVAFVGLLLVGYGDVGRSLAHLGGDLLALAGAVAIAGFFLVGRKLPDDADTWVFSSLCAGFGAVWLILACLAFGLPLGGHAERPLLFLFLAALFPQVVGHTLLTWSLKHVTPFIVAMAVVAEPILSGLWGALWLSERIDLLQGAGCLLTLLAVAGALGGREASPSKETP